MSRGFAVIGIRSMLALVVVTSVVFLWATAAQAQSPSDVQYGSPTASGTAAVSSADFSPSGSSAESSTGRGSAGTLSGVLPATGGSQFFGFALGTVALGATTGLLVLRRLGR